MRLGPVLGDVFVSADIKQVVRTEIEALHEFFVGWFSGILPDTSFDAGFLDRFDPDFLLVPPAGILLSGVFAE